MRIEDNQNLKEAIILEIARIEKHIMALWRVPNVVRCLNIQEAHPVIIRFGTDTELRVAGDDNQAFGINATSDVMQAYQAAVFEATQRQDLPKEPQQDRGRLEVHSAPDTPVEFINRAERIFDACGKVAEEMGLHYEKRGFHLHTTIVNNTKSLLASRNVPTFFVNLLVNQIVQDQMRMPCLFIKPRKAEKPKKTDTTFWTDLLTGRIGVGTNKNNSISLVAWAGKYYTDIPANKDASSPPFEQRLTTMVPYVPVLMMLSAIEKVLIKIAVDGENAQPIPLPSDEDLYEIHRGKGGYAHYLEKTIQEAHIEERFPELEPMLYGQIFADYRAYIEHSPRYKPEEKPIAQAQIDRIQATRHAHQADLSFPALTVG